MITTEPDAVALPVPEAGPALLPLVELAFDFLAVARLPDLTLETVTAGSRRLLQLDATAALPGRPLTDFLVSSSASRLRHAVLPLLAEGRSWRGPATLRDSRGTPVPARLVLLPVPAGEIPPGRVLVGALDWTNRSELQFVLEHEQLLLHAILDNVQDAISFTDRHGRYVRVSTAAAHKVGETSPLTLVGKTAYDYFAPEYAGATARDDQAVMSTGSPILDREVQEVWPDGRTSLALVSRYPLRDPRGTIVGTFSIARDITEQRAIEAENKRIEAQLQLAQKMESIGRLAAGVAHEVNTPTQFISDNTHFLLDAFQQLTRVLAAYRHLREVAVDPAAAAAAREAVAGLETETEIDYLLAEIPRTLEQTADGIARIGRIVRSLKEFSYPHPREKQPADLNHAIETAVAVSRHEWKLVADVVTELDPALPPVPCVLDEFNQVILNLIVNAAQAIGEMVADGPGTRGRITLRTRRAGESVAVEVEDTGPGIAPEIQNRIFEPFFTTKSADKGSGQGLALVHTFVVAKHGGTIRFTTEPGVGTTFHLTLPIQPPPAAAEPKIS